MLRLIASVVRIEGQMADRNLTFLFLIVTKCLCVNFLLFFNNMVMKIRLEFVCKCVTCACNCFLFLYM